MSERGEDFSGNGRERFDPTESVVEIKPEGTPPQQYFDASNTITRTGYRNWMFYCCCIPAGTLCLASILIPYIAERNPEEFSQALQTLKELIK
ncbi:MAG: hypothetical protein UT08_C0021G0003 [Candidatus Woesebacteria bacterium GW2011_GWB1_38_8]|uniref:Uncharacterized protein n=1 Tax=Candidatus Woesebacteria bacterium GW2011_GWB1_38_8 TaxID=1618570 RepID=A0A0G0P4J2_9BACT|nr:MAG: hypothetical protein UT08_C0021G0003 [Candidatus Woesebacteria bacterium GW2011_GWB1_38_8]